MSRLPLYRNVRARGMLELFLLSAISSLLAVRVYLHLAGYPQIGGSQFHIAHMLWGGLLMLAGLTIALGFIGSRSRWLTALIGGAGFGIFIDELGKFVTHDNNYFYRPAVGLIYVLFVVLYLVFNFLSRQQRLSSREYVINALSQMEEAVAKDLDADEKARVMELLAMADGRTRVVKYLQQMMEGVPTVKSEEPGLYSRMAARTDRLYAGLWSRRQTSRMVRLAFILEAVVLLTAVLWTAYTSIDDLALLFAGSTTYVHVVIVGQLVSAALAAGYIIYGAVLLPRQRLKAFEQLRRATLINLFLTQAFVFFRDQFAALPGFALNLAILLLITFVVHQEHRLQRRS